MKKRILTHILDSFLLLTGSGLMALAYNLFLIPHKIVPGGVGGLSMILNHFFNTPIGLVGMGLNVPLLIIGLRLLGKTYGLKTIVGMVSFSVMVDFFTYFVPIPPATDDTILACIFGGITLGAGLGLVFRSGGSTGGSDIVGQVIKRYSNLSIGSAILMVDFVVISLSGAAYQDFELALYGYLNLYLQIRVIDLVLEGVSYTRAVFIISNKTEAIASIINEKMNRGATLLEGSGAYTHENRPVIFSVMSKKEVVRARGFIRSVDPEAFVMITDIYEVQGEGFHRRSPISV